MDTKKAGNANSLPVLQISILEERPAFNKKIKAKPSLHGMTKNITYNSWYAMKQRCTNTNSKCFDRYGGRGILVNIEWGENFTSFLRDMGERPSRNHTLERKNNDGPYCKENCKWATRLEQARNRDCALVFTFLGKSKCLKEWAEYLGIKYMTVYSRYSRGLSLKKILSNKKLSRWDRT